jgi:hypothetical protein
MGRDETPDLVSHGHDFENAVAPAKSGLTAMKTPLATLQPMPTPQLRSDAEDGGFLRCRLVPFRAMTAGHAHETLREDADEGR